MIILSRTSDTYIPLKISANGSDDYILVGNDTVTLEIKYSGNVVLKKEFTVLDCDSYGKLTIVVTESEVRYLSNLNYTYSITMVLNGKTIEYSTGKLMIQDRRNSVSSFSSIYNNKYDITNVINDSLSKGDTVSNWQSSTVILPYGYIAISFDDDGTKKIKIGDGEKKWSELDFFKSGGEGEKTNELYLMHCNYCPYALVQNYGSAHDTNNVFNFSGWLHKPYCNITGGAHDNTTFFDKSINFNKYTGMHIIWQRASSGGWDWMGIYFADDTAGTNAHFLRRDCRYGGAYVWDWTSGEEVSVTTETQDYDIHQWDIDITAATGVYYLGLLASMGTINILSIWID